MYVIDQHCQVNIDLDVKPRLFFGHKQILNETRPESMPGVRVFAKTADFSISLPRFSNGHKRYIWTAGQFCKKAQGCRVFKKQ